MHRAGLLNAQSECAGYPDLPIEIQRHILELAARGCREGAQLEGLKLACRQADATVATEFIFGSETYNLDHSSGLALLLYGTRPAAIMGHLADPGAMRFISNVLARRQWPTLRSIALSAYRSLDGLLPVFRYPIAPALTSLHISGWSCPSVESLHYPMLRSLAFTDEAWPPSSGQLSGHAHLTKIEWTVGSPLGSDGSWVARVGIERAVPGGAVVVHWDCHGSLHTWGEMHHELQHDLHGLRSLAFVVRQDDDRDARAVFSVGNAAAHLVQTIDVLEDLTSFSLVWRNDKGYHLGAGKGIVDSLAALPSLRSLTLRSIPSICVSACCLEMAHLSTLTNLDLSEMDTWQTSSDATLNALLLHLPNLVRLTLDSVGMLGARPQEVLRGTGLKGLVRLERLSVRNNGFSSHDVYPLARAAARLPRLRSVHTRPQRGGHDARHAWGEDVLNGLNAVAGRAVFVW